MASGSSSSRRREATTTSSSASRELSARDNNFEEHLKDHGIHLTDGPQASSIRETLNPHLRRRQRSLSRNRFKEEAFRDFQDKNRQAVNEDEVTNNVISIICGSNTAEISSKRNVLFSELEPIAREQASKPQPDFFDGIPRQDVDDAVKDILYAKIVPASQDDVPVAPNFFLETASKERGREVARRRAGYDGACGARAMHSLQNYHRDQREPAYDGMVYAFSSTYNAETGQLVLYGHHVEPPAAPAERPTYHTTEIEAWDISNNIEKFRAGVTALRNAREMAQEHRDQFVHVANTRARGEDMPV